MKVMEDREIGSLWKGNWLMGDEPRVIKELIRKLVEERTFQVGFERAFTSVRCFERGLRKALNCWMPIECD
jgi:hypothetical protein